MLFSRIAMNRCSFSLERQLGPKLKSDIKWILYIGSVAKNVRKMVSSLYVSSKYLNPSIILYRCKRQIKPKMMYHIQEVSILSSLSILYRIQMVFASLWVMHYFVPCNTFHKRRNLISSCCAFAISAEIHSIVPPSSKSHNVRTLTFNGEMYVLLEQLFTTNNCFVKATPGMMLP